MSSTGFEYQVKDVARRARRLVWVHAAGWFTATVCLAALGAGIVDYLVCFRDAGARLISSAGVWLLTFWAVRRFLYPAWRYRCSDLLAAHRAERHFPVLRDRLSSALAFASQKCDDELAGSAELRQAVIAETESVARSLPLSDCLDRRRAWRAALVAVLLSGAIAALSLWDGASVALAARRLLLPLGDGPWLRRHVLTFVDPPKRLSTGQDFKVRLVDDKGGLPDRVEIHFWVDGDDQSKIQTEPMPLAGRAFTYRRPNVTRGFRYRATGGDDYAMPWIALDLVEPPRIVEQVVTLHPPSYTGLPPRATEGHFRALRETRVAVRVRVSKPLSRAVLETDTMDSDVPVALDLDRDRLGFSLPADAPVPWLVRKSGYYGFHLTEEDGLDVGAKTRWQVEAVSDTPPTASLIRPPGVSRVTNDATVMLEANVTDDLAIRSADLVFARSDENGHDARKVALWDVSSDAAANGSRIEAGGPDHGVQRMIRYEWDLAGLAGLEPGEWIDFHVAAWDNNGQQGESKTRRLTMISAGELEERVSQRQSEILAQVAEVARLQKQTRAQINDLEIQLREAGLLGRDDVDQWQNAELNQRHVQQQLADSKDGIASRIAGLLEELDSNRLNNPETARRLRSLADALRPLNEQVLPRVHHVLVDSLRTARETLGASGNASDTRLAASDGERLSASLRQVSDDQGQVVQALESMLGELSQWDSYRRLAREVSRLRREQEDVWHRTEQLRLRTLTQDLRDLSDQDRADLRRLTELQNEIARNFSTLASRVNDTRDQLLETDPIAAATLSDALDMIQRTGVGGTMREAGQTMGRNQLGQGSRLQEAVVQQLAELQDILANRREHQLGKAAEQLRDAAGQVGRLRERQQQVLARLDDGRDKTPAELQELAREESAMSEEAELLARRLGRLPLELAEESLDRAVKQLDAAARTAESGQLEPLRQHAGEAHKELDGAERSLQDAVNQTTQRLQDERLERLRRTLTDLRGRQSELLAKTSALEATRLQPATTPPSDQRAAVESLALRQNELRNDVATLRDDVRDIEAFALELSEIMLPMTGAGRNLEQGITAGDTQQLQQHAVDRLERFLAVLESEDLQTAPADQQQSPRTDDTRQQPTNRYVLAQLKLVRAMQDEVNSQTAALQQETGTSAEWSDPQLRQHQELVRRQGQLADLLARLLDDGDSEPRESPPRSADEIMQGLDDALDNEGTRKND